jgi:glycerophosphoryl diester phosphodiesterase
MIRLLHRGNTKKYLENSIEAVKSGINDNNFDGIEIDIRLTKDKKWIIYHDKNLKRLTKINKKIEKINYIDLPTINHKNYKYKIALLKELTGISLKNKILNIEIKSSFDIDNILKINLINIIKKINAKILISSFIWKWNIWSKKYNLPFGYLIENNKLPKINKTEYNLFILNYKLLNNKNFKEIINNNNNKLLLGCYTINSNIKNNHKYFIEIWDN